MNLEQWAFAPVGLPLLGAAFALCGKAFFKGRKATAAQYLGSAIGLFLPLLALAVLWDPVFQGTAIEGTVGSWKAGIAIRYRFDSLSWLLDLLSFTVGIAAWVYQRGADSKNGSFTTILLIQLASLAATMMTYDIFNLFVCLEILGVTSYVLIASSPKDGAAFASFSYLMVSATAMVFFLLGTFGLYRLSGNLSYEGIAQNLGVLSPSGELTYLVSLICIILAIAIRVAIMPLSLWLADAHSMAPHAVSAMLSGVLLKVPLFALTRILILFPKGGDAALLLAYAGSISALLGVIAALSQKDAKRLLAYHSISQIGYVVSAWGMAISVGLEKPEGKVLMAGALMYALYHGIFKALLFLSVGTTIDYAKERNVYKIRNASRILQASGEKFPLTMLCFFVGVFSITAIVPFNGYYSKTLVTYSLKGSFSYYLLTAAGVGTVASFIKLSRIFWPVRKKDAVLAQKKIQQGDIKFPKTLQLSLLFLALLCIAGGLFAPSIYGFLLQLLKAKPKAFAFYTEANLLKMLSTSIGGLLLFLLISTKAGSNLLSGIRNLPHTFTDHFFAFAVAAATLGSWLYFV
ncbi:formate hydrogenlyase subunit 3/multisubunit Na+/H+ antiporter, MnhD subunit [Sphaerochaeta pleomorpha str. Grapes]|uniref:Formate hydrogenlyase subunit 3/multisubunit Na+/H+ antiporter, MnhD subunit n=1 Tax=Sphaerochaeta pleomorpha (strain ATCC BAA-1885 / DSM 22778 / Grapes) TaxID=158190 RepID=G8QTV1_SPHPG|nr:proton-conducting transporter membrane subunit [Sphaerochaeta pleomorpha]AEV29127.1 formate hydrogenlyase subunit 3/multisubunit Na+/H+ antiporter, MnhD subunit [Sphaerochaeta pleomorpha str. Grapes]